MILPSNLSFIILQKLNKTKRVLVKTAHTIFIKVEETINPMLLGLSIIHIIDENNPIKRKYYTSN